MKNALLNIAIIRHTLSGGGAERIAYIDVFRSFGIIVMIMGHIGFGKYFSHFIFAFHMPMFFFISGMFFQVSSENGAQFLQKKIKTLLCPYVVFGCLGYGGWLLRHRGTDPLKHLLFENTKGLPIVGALWFLTALFWAEILYYIIKNFIKEIVLQNLIIILFSVFGCIATFILPFRLPYAMDVGFVGIGLIHIGYLFQNNMDKKYITNLFCLKKSEWAILSIITMGLILCNGPVDMRQGQYSIIPLFWINAALAIVGGINLAKYTIDYCNGKVISFLKYIGKNSIVYVCLNQLMIGFTKEILQIVGVHEIKKMADKILVFVLTMIVLHICAYILTTTKLKVFIGKSIK